MNVEEVLGELDRSQTKVPRIALEEAAAHREEIIPRLLAVLEEVAKNPEPFLHDQEGNLHIYALYLLAQFQETRAYPLLVRIFSVGGEAPFELAGDVVTQDLPGILASVSDGDMSGMMALAENEEVNEYVRSIALDGLVTLVACGRRTREEVMAYFQRLFQTLERKPSAVWDGLANSCADLCPREVMKELEQAYDDGLIDPGCIRWDDVQDALDKGPDASLDIARRRNRLITNTADAIKWWSCFHKDAEDVEGAAAGDDAGDDFVDFDFGADSLFSRLRTDMDFPQPIRRTEPKVGRNEPCPCGSGKKFKRCCGK
jgi:hypothetical protein